MEPLALVIQCYAKVDTLQGACDSLLRCTGIEDVHLILWSDVVTEGQPADKYGPLSREVQAYIDLFLKSHGTKFRSVTRQSNKRNLGTCKTCETALNYAFSLHSFAIFAEDDVVFSRDALLWFDGIRQVGLLDDERCWAIAGEAVFFNAADRFLPPQWPELMRDLVVREGLIDTYTSHNFIPSTCFATTDKKWREFGSTRGLPLGDVDVCQRCEAEDRHTIFPIVPRVKDVGMLHEHGYSVMLHSRDGVKEVKNTYLTSDSIEVGETKLNKKYVRFSGDANRLYAATTQLREL